jgi:hypothetical protein
MEARLGNLDSLLQRVAVTSSPVSGDPQGCRAIGSPDSITDRNASADHWLQNSTDKGMLMDSREVSLRVLAHTNRELLVRL